MTRQEAFKSMYMGNKITHQYFSPGEYYYLKDDSVYAKDSVNHTTTFWANEESEQWRETGWEVYPE